MFLLRARIRALFWLSNSFIKSHQSLTATEKVSAKYSSSFPACPLSARKRESKVLQINPTFVEVLEDLKKEASLRGFQDSGVCQKVINDGIGLMRYCRNHNIYRDNHNVERAVILIHGSCTNEGCINAGVYFNTTLTEAIAEGVDLNKIDIIAPQFFEGLPDSTNSWTDYYVWRDDWRYGDLARNRKRSSYEVIDHIVGQLVDHRPNLKTIVVAGQSAGGQFADHYSLGTRIPRGIRMRFWVANPAFYLWLTPLRPYPPELSCSSYNRYPGVGHGHKGSWRSPDGHRILFG